MLVRLGVSIREAWRVGWGNAVDFCRHLDQTSATWRALHPEEAAFMSPLRQAAMLADVFDAVTALHYSYVSLKTGKRSKRPRPYPRPWDTVNRETTHFGGGAIPIADFDAWYYGKREQPETE